MGGSGNDLALSYCRTCTYSYFLPLVCRTRSKLMCDERIVLRSFFCYLGITFYSRHCFLLLKVSKVMSCFCLYYHIPCFCPWRIFLGDIFANKLWNIYIIILLQYNIIIRFFLLKKS